MAAAAEQYWPSLLISGLMGLKYRSVQYLIPVVIIAFPNDPVCMSGGILILSSRHFLQQDLMALF
jgi:hypothetical protein